MASQFVGLEFTCNARGTFYGSLATHRLGIHNLLLVKSTSQRVIRSFDRNGGETEDFYVLNYLIEGHGRTAQNGNFHPVSAGEFFVFDPASPARLDPVGAFPLLTLSSSRPLVDLPLSRPQFLAPAPATPPTPRT